MLADGLEAVVFTADGDMRQALNNLQAVASNAGLVNQEAVFKVAAYPVQHACMQAGGHAWRLHACLGRLGEAER